MTSSLALANEGLFELTRRPLMFRFGQLQSFAETTMEAGFVGCVKCQLLWKWWLPQVFPMTLTPKNMEMPKNFKKIVSRGWSRAPLVLLHSVSIGRSEFYFYIHFDPVNQVRNPSKLNRLWGPYVSLLGAFDCIKFGQPGGKMEVKRWNMIIAIYTYAMSWLQLHTKVTFVHQKFTKTLQTLQDMLQSGWSFWMHQLW